MSSSSPAPEVVWAASTPLTLAREGASVVVNDLGGARRHRRRPFDGRPGGRGRSRTPGPRGGQLRQRGRSRGRREHRQDRPDEFGKIDGVVSNAGILRDGTFQKMPFENWDSVLKVHLYGGYNVIRAAWPHFREQSWPHRGRHLDQRPVRRSGRPTTARQARPGRPDQHAGPGGRQVQHQGQCPRSDRGHPHDRGHPAARGVQKLTRSTWRRWWPTCAPRRCRTPLRCSSSVAAKVQRAALFQNEGVTFDHVPTVDDVAAQWSTIDDLAAAKPANFKLG